jgi:hypothetical protein
MYSRDLRVQLDAAATSQADIVAIGVSAGLNSVAAAVLEDTGCPVLLVPGERVVERQPDHQGNGVKSGPMREMTR